MADEPTASGWLPPRARGGEPAPQFEPAPPDPEPEPEAVAEPVDPWPHPINQPRFTATAAPSANGLATTSLVLGILGLLILIPGFGVTWPLSLPFSIAAWAIGVQGRNLVSKGVTTTGDGTAHAGVILGIVGVVIGMIAAAISIALLLAGYDLDDLRRFLEDQQAR
jgi:hypothetical protein